MPSSARELIEWKPEYSVGVESIDKQHQLLVSMIAHLNEAMLEGRTRQIIEPLFTALHRYTQFHFEFEEQLLQSTGYAEFEPHRASHLALLNDLKELEAKYVQGSLTAGAPLMQFLRQWLIGHICHKDKEYGPHVRQHSAH